jgi:hypothetical protein
MRKITAFSVSPTSPPRANTAMNRQAAPSIVLSVLIVCFFAVALFQRDPPRAAPDQKQRVVGGAIDGSRSVQATKPDLSPSRPIASTARSNASSVSIVSSARRLTNNNVFGRDAEAPRVGAVLTSTAPSRRPASVRSPSSPIASSLTLPNPRTPGKIAVARRPRSAFTVVEADETISDVALRIYGTTEEVESLWQANRESLQSRDSPISSGMLLRTPRVR